MPKVSVIIPVYNVEPYIERCLHSLFSQTLDDMEFIFVDDCSADGSSAKIAEVLGLYPARKAQTRVLRHEVNRGVAAARTSGIVAAEGDYIIHCDPDDYVDTDMYEAMYDRAVAVDADIVACHYMQEYADGRRVAVCKDYGRTPQECLKNIYRRNRHCGSLCDKLVRRSLIAEHGILPFEGCDYAEDLGCVVRILHYASTIVVVERPLYHYCRRGDSLTGRVGSLRVWNMRKKVTDHICRFLSCDQSYRTACHQMQFYAKMEQRAAFEGREREWFDIYRESHDDILRYDDMPLKGRILWWTALRSYGTFRMVRKFIPSLL